MTVHCPTLVSVFLQGSRTETGPAREAASNAIEGLASGNEGGAKERQRRATIYHRVRLLMVGTLRFARPTFCELICFARKRNLNVQLRQTGTTGKSPKTCPALGAKIFCFRSHPNQPHNSARLTADEGRWPSSRTCGEMRWTRELQLTCVA